MALANAMLKASLTSSRDLLSLLNLTVDNRGEVTLLWEDIMRRCSAIYPELFAVDHVLPKHALSEQALPQPTKPQTPVPLSLKVIIGDQMVTLNMAKIRSHLVNSSLDQPLQNGRRRVISARRRIIMLQALRWVTSNSLLYRAVFPVK